VCYSSTSCEPAAAGLCAAPPLQTTKSGISSFSGLCPPATAAAAAGGGGGGDYLQQWDGRSVTQQQQQQGAPGQREAADSAAGCSRQRSLKPAAQSSYFCSALT